MEEIVKRINNQMIDMIKLASYPIPHFTLGGFDEANKPEIILTPEIITKQK